MKYSNDYLNLRNGTVHVNVGEINSISKWTISEINSGNIKVDNK